MLANLLKRRWRSRSSASRLRTGYSRLLADDLSGASAIADELLADDPGSAAANLLAAQVAAARGQWDAALARIGAILAREPRHAEALYIRGMVHERRNDQAQALADFAQVLAIDPAHAAALDRKGALHDARAEFELALECAKRLAELNPGDASAYDKLGITLRELGRLEEAADAFRRALQIDPGLAAARCHLALVLTDQGRFEAADAELQTVLAAQTDHREGRWVRAVGALLQGRFETGWDDYEWRDARVELRAPFEAIPEWDGAPLREGALFVYAEQGLGDHIMFASCIPDAAALAPHCVVECDPRLQPLFQRSFPDVMVLAATRRRPDPRGQSLPAPVAAQIPLGSLPRLFRRHAAAFPAHRGYLRPDPAAVARWRARLEALGPGLKIGLSWTGGAAKTRRRLRSLPLQQLLPLFAAGSARFVSLQYVDSAAEIAALRDRHGVTVHQFDEVRASYDEAAALVGALDLVVTVCTAVAHLAGAIGTPVWIMAPAAPEWRYLASGTRLPWYPAARVWRQKRLGEWDEVVQAIAAELVLLAQTPRAERNDEGVTDAR